MSIHRVNYDQIAPDDERRFTSPSLEDMPALINNGATPFNAYFISMSIPLAAGAHDVENGVLELNWPAAQTAIDSFLHTLAGTRAALAHEGWAWAAVRLLNAL